MKNLGKKRDKFFLISIGLFIGLYIIFSRSSLSTKTLFSVCTKVSEILIVSSSIVYGLTKKIKIKQFIFYIVFIVLGGLTWKLTKDKSIILIIIICFGLRDIDFFEIVKIFTVSILGACGIIIGGSLIGIFPQIVTTGVSIDVKNSFGFILPNTAGITLLILILCSLYLSGRLQKYVTEGIVLVPLFVLLYFTGARTSLVVAVIGLVMWLAFLSPKIRFFTERHLVAIVMGTLIASILFSIFSTLAMKNAAVGSTMYKMNELLSNRLSLQSTAVDTYGLTFFGQYIPYNLIPLNEQWWNKSSMFWVDNSYIKILIGEGIIWLPMLLLVAYYQSRRAQVGKDVFYVILACTIFMMGVSESSFLYFWANIVLITSTASFGSKGDFLNELEES